LQRFAKVSNLLTPRNGGWSENGFNPNAIPRSVCRMSDPVSSIRNLGPAYEQSCARAGISSAEELRTLGADAAYARLLKTGTRPHFIGYYVLVMGLQGRPWNDCKGAEKSALRKRFDALKAGSFDKARSELETMLDRLGVIDRATQRRK